MCWTNFALALAIGVSLATAAPATEPVPTAPRVQRRMATQDFPAPRRFRAFSGGTNSNWWRSRGTPPDNSTIPTPINRHPKGAPTPPFQTFPRASEGAWA